MYDKDDKLLQRFEYADGRMPLSFTDNSGDLFYISYNQIGSPRAITDRNGNVLKSITYDSFGTIVHDSNPLMKIPFGFAGGLYDSDTKLTRFGYRDYDASTGKWTAKDPIGFDGGDTNILAYVGSDPVNKIDSFGLYDDPRLYRGTGSPVDKAQTSRQVATATAAAGAFAGSLPNPYAQAASKILGGISAFATFNAQMLDRDANQFKQDSMIVDIATTATDYCKQPMIEFFYDQMFTRTAPYVFDY